MSHFFSASLLYIFCLLIKKKSSALGTTSPSSGLPIKNNGVMRIQEKIRGLNHPVTKMTCDAIIARSHNTPRKLAANFMENLSPLAKALEIKLTGRTNNMAHSYDNNVSTKDKKIEVYC